jgi:hypothetical protein
MKYLLFIFVVFAALNFFVPRAQHQLAEQQDHLQGVTVVTR